MSAYPVQSVFIFANPEKKRAREEVIRLKKWLRSRGIHCLGSHELSRAQAIITLGGDGTILAVSARAAQAGVPVFGINIGHLGFMTAVGVHGMYAALNSWLKGKWIISERRLLEVQAPRVSQPLLALNEAVVRLGSTTRVTTISVHVDNRDLGAFTGDGLIVATATGSTAYSLAAQGPVVHPDVDALILTPICPHSLTQRPIVFPANQTVELRLDDFRKGNEVQLCLDGHRVFLIKPGDRVVIRASDQKLKLLHDPKIPYYGVLKEKLSWGGS